jgi:hypothetical protein
MPAFVVNTLVSEWLAAEQFLDAGVSLASVRFHDSGLPSVYLRLVKKRAMTLGGHIFFRDATLTDQARQANWPLYAHELVHVGQYRQMGTARFVLAYMRDMAKARFRYSRALPLEAPAYERQHDAEKRLGLR